MTAPAGRLTPRERAATQHTMAAVGVADAPPALESGTTVAKRYFVRSRIGRGGMGEVYEAQDVALGEIVALKTLRHGLTGVTVDQFRQEAQLARRVTHVNVCRIHDIGHHEGMDFLTMELLAGETLSARLDRVGRLTLDEARALLAQIVAGVHAAHEAGIVHRDLKCGNIMIVPGGRGERAVITDFGLALVAGVTPGSIAGSPAYMAPEQVTGGEVGAAADLYALGVIMFEMVTGKLPFVGDTAEQTARKRLDTPPPSPRSLVPGVDTRWERAVLRCLARAPGDRFAQAPEVLAAVTPPPRRPTRWLIAGLAVAVGVGGAVLAGTRGAAPATNVATLPPPVPASPHPVTSGPAPAPAPAPVPAPPPPPLPPAVARDVAAARDQALEQAEIARAQAARALEHSDDAEQRADREQERKDRAAEAAEERKDRAAEAAQAAEDGQPESEAAATLDRGVRRVGPGRVEINLKVLDALAGDPDLVLGSAHIEAAMKDGKSHGVQLVGIGRGTLLDRLGFHDGDTITSLGGVAIAAPEEARSALEKLHDFQHVVIGFERRGKPRKLDVRLSLTR